MSIISNGDLVIWVGQRGDGPDVLLVGGLGDRPDAFNRRVDQFWRHVDAAYGRAGS